MRLSNGEALAARVGILIPIVSFLKIGSTIKSAFILVLVIDKEIFKTKVSFLASWDIYLHNNPFCHSYNT